MVFTSKVILAVGAHPDDIELGCGGTVFKSIHSGSQVVALYMSRGGKTSDTNIRMAESSAALKILGVTDINFEDFPDTEIPNSFKAINCLEKYAVKYNPDIILTHSVNDMHQDHRTVGFLAMAAFRNVPKILAFETPRVRPGVFLPNYFVNITGYVNKKAEALHCHASQKGKRYLAYESTVNLASFRGSQVGVDAAEAFEIVKYVEM